MIERSALLTDLGIAHGFTTRLGGVSQGRFSSLNMGGKWGDDPHAVAENRARVGRAAGFDPGDLRLARQVHRDGVVHVAMLDSTTEGDALWAHRDDGEQVPAVLTADCVPILLADRDGSFVCAVHSGWRGTVARISERAVTALVAAGARAERLIAAIGPSIGLAAFEVGEEVASQFPAAVVDRGRLHAAPTGREIKPHVDLTAAVRLQLEAAGIPSDAIERVGGCTHDDVERYFSYRRDGANIGQMMAFIRTRHAP